MRSKSAPMNAFARIAAVTFAAVTLAACSQGAAAVSTPPLGTAPSLHALHGGSWMLRDAKRRDLLYVSEFYDDEVLVYSYPRGGLVGTITGVSEPQGMCGAPKSGTWWVVATGSSQVFEYEHGGSSPIATIDITEGTPASCAVDPKTGNLAVTIITNDDVVVFPKGSGSGTTYIAPFQPFFSTYDDRSDLFVDGSGTTNVAELPKGSGTFEPIALDQTIIFQGGLQWSRGLLAVGDQDAAAVYRFSIGASTGTLQGTTALQNGDPTGFWIEGGKLIGPASGDEGIWKYPAGGAARRTVGSGFYGPTADLVSSPD